MITRTGIRRPDVDIELGTRVRYHHRACVARLRPASYSGGRRYWFPSGQGKPDPLTDPQFLADISGRSINKSVSMWPEEGIGIVISLIRRGIGHSVGPSGGGAWDDFEPGYFEDREWVWLFVVKTSMHGMDVVLVPMDALEVL